MTRDPFITPRLSIWLDLARALAALAVLAGHAAQLGYFGTDFPFSMALQKNAVVIFFALSGLVIADSTLSRNKTLRDYTMARFARIVPVALCALLAALLIAALDVAQVGEPVFAEHAGAADPLPSLLALGFLSTSFDTGFALNPPYWSLCYEVFFYALFAAFVFTRGAARIVWLAAIACLAGANILLLLPAWLAGVAVARHPAARDIAAGHARLLIVLALAMLFVAPAIAPTLSRALSTVAPWDLGYSLYALSDAMLAASAALAFAGLRTVGEGRWAIPARIVPPIRFVAGMSFTLYVLHWPLLKAWRIAGLPESGDLAGYALVLAYVLAVSALVAALVERSRIWRDLFARLFERVRPARARPVELA